MAYSYRVWHNGMYKKPNARHKSAREREQLLKYGCKIIGASRNMATGVIYFPVPTLPFLSLSPLPSFNVAGLKVDIDRWRTNGRHEGVYTYVTKARAWNEIVNHKYTFLLVNGWQASPANEIRLRVHMAIDWYAIRLYFTCEFVLKPLQVFLGSQQPLSKCFIGPVSFVVSNLSGTCTHY